MTAKTVKDERSVDQTRICVASSPSFFISRAMIALATATGEAKRGMRAANSLAPKVGKSKCAAVKPKAGAITRRIKTAGTICGSKWRADENLNCPPRITRASGVVIFDKFSIVR